MVTAEGNCTCGWPTVKAKRLEQLETKLWQPVRDFVMENSWLTAERYLICDKQWVDSRHSQCDFRQNKSINWHHWWPWIKWVRILFMVLQNSLLHLNPVEIAVEHIAARCGGVGDLSTRLNSHVFYQIR